MTEAAVHRPVGAAGVRIISATAGEVSGAPGGAVDRFLIDGTESGGLLALVEHTVPPGVLAAPIHRHSREDEYSFVIVGRVGVLQDDKESVATAGDVVVKPRGRWHTFWNAGDQQLRLLEIIAPGGLEQLFRRLGALGGEYDPQSLPAMAAEYGCDVDFERTVLLIERHGLSF